MHTLIVLANYYWNARDGRKRHLDSLSAPGILGRIRVQSIHHAAIFRNKRTGASERAEQELSDTAEQRATHGHVRSGQERETEQKPRAPDGFVVWLSLARDLPEPRRFRCPAHVHRGA
jgi:hypothetical protein